MNKEKLYLILTSTKSYLWLLAVILGLIGRYMYKNNFLHFTAYILFILGISQILMYSYFRKSSDLGYISTNSKMSAVIIFILSIAEFYGGYYILVNFP